MKKYIFLFFTCSLAFIACQNGEQPATTSSSSENLPLPYTAEYTTGFNDQVSDSDLLLVLNSYKYWENGDWDSLRSTMGDSMTYNGFAGASFSGPTDSLKGIWTNWRDSLSSVKIMMTTWLKTHAIKDGRNYISTWLKEIDTYKDGRVDSANYYDIHSVKEGKIDWYSSYRQELK